MTIGTHTVTKWFCTPLTNAERHIDGPFQTRDACERRCIQLASDEAKASIVEALLETQDLRFAVSLYIPTPVVLQSSGPAPQATAASTPPVLARFVPASLLNKLKQLPRGKLMQIAGVIGIQSQDHNKHALAAVIFKALKTNATKELLP